jgi:phage major head subunit gpT-like protein
MAITNTTVYGNHLDRDVNDIFFDDYEVYRREYPSIAKMENAPAGNHYTESEISPLGALREIPEGNGIYFDIPVEGHKKVVYYTKYGLGFQITEEMMKDDLFGNFKKMPKKLAKSAALKPDAVFWDLFNNGFGTHTAWDSQYVFDTDHSTLKSGTTIANEPATAGTLSETTLQAAYEYFDAIIDEAGFPIQMTPFLVVVPTELRWTAGKLLQTEFQVGSANNDVNTVNPGNNIVPSGWNYFVSRYLTSTTAWFLLAKEHDFRILWKDNTRLESADDFYTGNALFKVVQRYAVFVMDYKGAYGNEGA